MDTQNFQDLQEISKKLLGSYVSKAGEDLRRNKNKEFLKRGDAEYHDSGSRRSGSNPELAAQEREDAKRYSHKADRRAKGLAMAGKKIANESTLREYVNNVVNKLIEDIQTPKRAKQQEDPITEDAMTAERDAELRGKMKQEKRKKDYGEYLRLYAQREKEAKSKKLYGKGGKVDTSRKPDVSKSKQIWEDVYDSSTSAAAIKKNKGKGGKVVSEGAVEKIKEKIKGMLGKTPKNPKAKKEQKPGLMSSIRTAVVDYPKAKKEQKPGLMSSIRTAAGDIVGHSGIFDIL
jgi:hypothetical protein